ncbi:Uncharacterised protein [uncultured Clostridium sp.]|uniref:hypothetical protein n=1 Tax=uncultured Clostridium sp. TaxID=59620 RepID=UPI000820B561|nr:hypothetical protein [uncultured Clostridium sp.]SCJ38591.1 Uncharacterised protein [uncultured Clostridium sp.]
MKNLIKVNDTLKILIIYTITTIISMVVAGFVVEYDYIKGELKNYLWVMLFFTISFLILIRLFKVKFKSVLIFLGIIMFLLLFLLLNLDFFISIASTPDEGIFPIMTFIALYTTLPFQGVINTLVGYDLGKLSYIILPAYMLTLALISYITLNSNAKNYNKECEQA